MTRSHRSARLIAVIVIVCGLGLCASWVFGFILYVTHGGDSAAAAFTSDRGPSCHRVDGEVYVELSISPQGVDPDAPRLIRAELSETSDTSLTAQGLMGDGIGWEAHEVPPSSAELRGALTPVSQGFDWVEVTGPRTVLLRVASGTRSSSIQTVRLYWGGGEPVYYQDFAVRTGERASCLNLGAR